MKRIDKEELEAVMKVLRRDPTCLSGYYKNEYGGPSVQAFEKALAEYNGVEYAVCVSNGTTALHATLLACGIGLGDEVITTPLTFSATATSIMMTGARPVFVDVDTRTYNIDAWKIERAMTKKTKAIIPVHLLGLPCDMLQILESVSDEFIIEDNAQAFGAKYRGEMTGTLSDVSTVSFQETKMITTGGEGGAILTNNDEIAEKCMYLRNHGSQYGKVPYLTYNYRMTEIQAALGLVQLGRLDEFIKIQVENAKILFDALPENIHPPYIPDYVDPTFYIIGCTVDKGFPREEFVQNLTKRGINKGLPGATVGLGYTSTIMDLPLLKPYKRSCPVAEELVKTFLWFDCLRWKTEEEAKQIVEAIIECVP